MKSEDGDLLPSPLGETLTTFGSENRDAYLIASVNIGVARNIQIPIKFEESTEFSTVQATIWDSKVFGQTPELHQVTCVKRTW